MRGRWCLLVVCAPMAASTANADVVATLDHWSAQLNFGVFADGGLTLNPIQGPESLVLGSHTREWDRVDGVASARAKVEYGFTIDATPARLFIGLDVVTAAEATVGDNPEYPHERGMAEAFLDFSCFDVTVLQPALLRVVGASLGSYGPGMHLLEPGSYSLALTAPLGRSSIDVGPNQTGSSSAAMAATFEITPVPAPASVAVLAGLGLSARHRRACRR